VTGGPGTDARIRVGKRDRHSSGRFALWRAPIVQQPRALRWPPR
jgi:hypothetical protein